MAEQQRPDDLAQLRAELAAQRAVTDAQGAEIARLKRRRRLPRRALPVLLAALLVALVPLATLAANPFADLTGGVHDPNIDAIYNAGITTGCGPTAYCPTETVTREQMASFLARTAGLGGNPPIANAATAVNATNAQNATNATNAATAQNALALGGEPPAFYQPAGQPIANAQNAVNAQNATNAQNAQNASTVGGFAPNELVRVARGSAQSVFSLAVLTDRATVRIIAPRAGFVLVSGTISATGGDSCLCFLHILAYHTQSNSHSNYQSATVLNGQRANVPVTWIFPVGAGEQTFRLQTGTGNAATVTFFNPTLTALYVPFGSGGVETLETPDQPAPSSPQLQPGETNHP